MATATIGFCDYRCDWFCRGYPAIKFVVASRYNKVCCGFFAPTQFTAIFLAVTKTPCCSLCGYTMVKPAVISSYDQHCRECCDEFCRGFCGDTVMAVATELLSLMLAEASMVLRIVLSEYVLLRRF